MSRPHPITRAAVFQRGLGIDVLGGVASVTERASRAPADMLQGVRALLQNLSDKIRRCYQRAEIRHGLFDRGPPLCFDGYVEPDGEYLRAVAFDKIIKLCDVPSRRDYLVGGGERSFGNVAAKATAAAGH